MDCDMLVLDDIAKLWALRDSRYAVQVVKHDHRPKETIKFLGAEQVPYEKKNWSSVMLFNNAMCRALTPEFVNTATGLELHQFKWLAGDHLIGELPSKWNHLVGYDAHIPDASLVHYTIGGPYFPAYEDCAYGDEWRAERECLHRECQHWYDRSTQLAGERYGGTMHLFEVVIERDTGTHKALALETEFPVARPGDHDVGTTRADHDVVDQPIDSRRNDLVQDGPCRRQRGKSAASGLLVLGDTEEPLARLGCAVGAQCGGVHPRCSSGGSRLDHLPII